MAKEIKIDIIIDASKSARSINDLNKSLNDMKTIASELDPVSEEFKKLNAEIVKTDTKVKNLGKSLEGLDTDAKAGELGKLAGGLSAVGSAAALAFAGNDDAEKFFKTFAQGIAVTNAVKGGIESYTASVKLLTKTTLLQDIAQKAAAAAQLIYTTAVGSSTGALKLFRLALIGTGIGAIIVGIGLLIANFDKVSEAVSNAVKKFREMGPVMKAILYPITLAIAAFDGIIFALEKLGVIDDENTKKMKANAEERVLNTKKEGDEISARYDLEIRKAAAAGKDVLAIEREKRLAILENIKLQGEAIRAQVKATGEFTEDQKKQLKELTDLAKKTKDDLIVGDITAEKAKNDARIKANEEAAKKIKEEKDALKKIEDQERKDLYAEEIVVNEELDAIDTEFYEKGLKKEEEQTQASLDGMKIIQEEELDAQIKALKDEEIIAQTKDDIRQGSIDNAIGGLNTLAALDKDNKALQAAALVAGNVAAIAQTIQSTTIANAKAVAAFPVTFGQPWVGINTVSAGIGIAASIAATAKGLSALGAGGSPGAKPSLPSGGGGGGAAPAPSVNTQQLFATQQLQGAETEQVSSGGIGQQQQVIKAVVSERDVTAVQNRISNYEQRSEIG
jgi:hypothetical protein